MKANSRLLSKWNQKLKEYGVSTVSNDLNIHWRKLYRILETGRCTDEEFTRINQYIIDKSETIDKQVKRVIKS